MDVNPTTVAGPNGELIRRNQTPHWALFLLARADSDGLAPLPPEKFCELDDALQPTAHLKDICERFTERGWAVKVAKTDYKYKPNGWQLTNDGETVLRTLGAPTQYPNSQIHAGESVERVLPDHITVDEHSPADDDVDKNVETESLEPDWEWLSDRLANLSQYELAARARDEDLSPHDVYSPGGVLDVVYGEQEHARA